MTPLPDSSQRRAASLAGAAYFVIIVTSLVSVAVGTSGLTMGGLIPGSLQEIAQHNLLYRVGAVYELLMYAGVVLLSVALYKVLAPVNQGAALLALLWRCGEAVVGFASVVMSLTVLELASPSFDTAVAPDQRLGLVMALLQAMANSISALMVFLCLGTLVNCALFYRSRYIPRWLSVFGLVSCGMMLLAGLVELVLPDLTAGPLAISSLCVMAFEIVIGFWLWFRGVRPRTTEASSSGRSGELP